MAVVQNTLIGKSSGSVGGTTFASWKGLNILKAKAQNSYSNPTSAQQNNNSKFAVFNIWAKALSAFILVGFKAMAVKMTDYNAFSKSNPYSRTVVGTAPNYVVDPVEIVLSKGPELQSGLASATKTAVGANQIDVTFPSFGVSGDGNQVYAAAFDNATGELLSTHSDVFYTFGGEVQLLGTGLGTNIANVTVHVFWVNSANGKACDSLIVPSA